MPPKNPKACRSTSFPGIVMSKLKVSFCSQMIEPLKTDLVRLLLDGIRYDRLGGSTGNTGGTQFQTDATLKGVISSFVEVEEYKKKGNLEVRMMTFI